MARVIGLLRGVNVCGHKLALPELRKLCEEAGCTDVQTYIQSGNVVFAHKSAASDKLRADLETRITKHAGYDVPVMLRTAKQLDAAIRANPFDEPDGTKLHLAFLASPLKKGALDSFDLDAYAPEEFRAKGTHIYLHLPNGIGRGV